MEQLNLFTEKYFVLLIILVIWSIPWKGFALWKSSRRGEKIWFIVFLLLNTIGILEILYLFFFSERGSSTSLQTSSRKETV